MADTENWSRTWWTVEGELVVPSAQAPEWLKKEFEDYNKAWEDYEQQIQQESGFEVHEPSSRHPLIDRMSDEEYDEMCRLVRG